MAAISTLAVQLTARTGPFRKGIARAEKRISKFSASVGALTLKAAKFSAALGVAAVAGLALLTRQAFKTLDAIGKMSDQIGISVDALQGLQLAAQLTGLSSDTLEKSLKIMTRRIGEAQQGFGEGERALESLNLKVKDLEGLAPEVQFKLIADGMAGIATQTEKAAIANQLFGRSGVDLLNTLQLGSGAIDDLIKENRRLQGSLSRIEVKKIEEANDAITRLGTSFTGFVNRLSVGLAPVVTNAAGLLTELFITFREDALPVIADFVSKGVSLFRSFIVAVLPTIILFANTVISSITLASNFFITGINLMITGINALSVGLGGGELSFKSFKETFNLGLVSLKFAFENFGLIVDAVTDRLVFAWIRTGNDLRAIFDNIGKILVATFLDATEIVVRTLDVLVANITRILANLPGLISGKVNFTDLLINPLETFESRAAEVAENIFGRELSVEELFAQAKVKQSTEALGAALVNSLVEGFAALDATETGLGKLFDKLLDFDLKIPEIPKLSLNLDDKKTLDDFPKDEKLEAAERGTVAAFQAERRQFGTNEGQQLQKQELTEAKTTNMLLNDIKSKVTRPAQVVSIET